MCIDKAWWLTVPLLQMSFSFEHRGHHHHHAQSVLAAVSGWAR
jgi:hypothetical protein